MVELTQATADSNLYRAMMRGSSSPTQGGTGFDGLGVSTIVPRERYFFEEERRTAEVGGGGGVVFLPVPQIPELIVEVVTLSELQGVDGSRNSGGGPVLLSTSWWTFQSATETGLLRRASDSVHRQSDGHSVEDSETERRHDVTSPKLFHLIFSTRKAT